MPAAEETNSPKLDNNLKSQVPKEGKDADRTLSRFQALLLDTVGPLASMLELKQAGRLIPEFTADAATQALRLLGNAHANFSVERRKHIASFLNKDLRPLLGEPERFTSAAPLLFWQRLCEAGQGTH
jgi:hypothetical protein